MTQNSPWKSKLATKIASRSLPILPLDAKKRLIFRFNAISKRLILTTLDSKLVIASACTDHTTSVRRALFCSPSIYCVVAEMQTRRRKFFAKPASTLPPQAADSALKCCRADGSSFPNATARQGQGHCTLAKNQQSNDKQGNKNQFWHKPMFDFHAWSYYSFEMGIFVHFLLTIWPLRPRWMHQTLPATTNQTAIAAVAKLAKKTSRRLWERRPAARLRPWRRS